MGVIAIIGVVGYLRGLNMLQRLEDWSLWITIVIILALLAGFALFDLGAMRGDGIQLPDRHDHTWWEAITIIGGTLIVVQGFETSRYLGGQFDTATRIRSSRLSQIISTTVYLAFVALATPLMHFLGDEVDDNALIHPPGQASGPPPVSLLVAPVPTQCPAGRRAARTPAVSHGPPGTRSHSSRSLARRGARSRRLAFSPRAIARAVDLPSRLTSSWLAGT